LGGKFIHQIYTQRRNIKIQRDEFQKGCDGLANWGMAIQDLGGLLISRPECPLVFGEKRYPVKSFDEGVTISAKDQQEYTNAFERGQVTRSPC